MEEAPRREGEASDATSLQLVKLEEGPRKGFAGGSEVSLHGSMIGLMGEMLQQMKEPEGLDFSRAGFQLFKEASRTAFVARVR